MTGGLPPGGRLAAVLRAGQFAVTAEIGPPRDADPGFIADKAALLRGWVDAANVTDNQGARVRMSSLAGSLLVQQAGIEPVMQLTCRDRNRMALQSDLLAAGALGIANVLLLTGDHPCLGDHPEAKPVFDLDGVQLTWVARTLRDDGKLMAGQAVATRPRWLIGTVENPFAPPVAFRARRLAKKVAAGAEFVQTQYVFDPGLFARWMAEVRELGVPAHCIVIAGVGPIRSLRVLEFLRTGVPGIHVPDQVERRLRSVPAGKVAAAGIELCVETIQQVAQIAGVSGVHVMAFGFERGIPEIVERAGVGPAARSRAVLAPASGDRPPSAVRALEDGSHAG
jgi:methylenetetrahydrofolate reductase (NADH)